MIGPLGVPVRKVAEVGHRGLQRIMNKNHQLGYNSPTQQKNANDPSNLYNAYAPKYPNQPQQPQPGYPGYEPIAQMHAPNPWDATPSYEPSSGEIDPTGVPMDVQAMRDAAAKQLQLDTAKALEQQIEAKKARVAAEKEKERLAELREEEKLQREQMEMAKKFEEEIGDVLCPLL